MTSSSAGADADRGGRPIAPERYESLEILGQGAMGVVYKARDRELDRVVAIKTIHPDTSSTTDSEAIAARLSREAMAAARLSHPGIVTVYDVGRMSGAPYVVMEYATGRTLAEILEAGPLPPERAVDVVRQVCAALEYAHGRGVVHRDIKSSNIMVDAGWSTKLTDFGVARIVDKPTHEARVMVGTPAYMSPEQARGDATDARSDLFSVGVVLYETLTGSRPFPGDDVSGVLDAVVGLDPVPPRERNFAVSPALDAVVRRAMSKDPDDRYPDAAAFASALTQAVAVDEPAAVAQLFRHARSRTAVLSGVAAMALALATGFHLAPRAYDLAPRLASPPVDAPSFVPPEPPREAHPPSEVVVEPPPVVTAAAAAPPPARAVEEPAAPLAKPGCLSVNAVPFATVYLNGRPVGETPQACVRVRPGRHRVRFEWNDRRSPEHTIVLEPQHTLDEPLRVSYDFRAGRFRSHAD